MGIEGSPELLAGLLLGPGDDGAGGAAGGLTFPAGAVVGVVVAAVVG